MEYSEIKINNPGILNFSIPQNIHDKLINSTINIKNLNIGQKKLISLHNTLAGQIEEEYRLTFDEEIKNYIINCSNNYSQHFNYMTDKNFYIESFWVNFQKKHEYNPVHRHTSSLSFVIFLKIPYNFKNEDGTSWSKNSINPLNGRLFFIYNSMFTGIDQHPIDIDSSFEGKMIMFPSTAMHGVYPFFTSDEYRITAAGNILTK